MRRIEFDGETFTLGAWKGVPCWIKKLPGRPPRPYLRGSCVEGVGRYLKANAEMYRDNTGNPISIS